MVDDPRVVTALLGLLVDGRTPDARSITHAGTALRGGTWIGALERAEGVGRYPELRHGESSGTAERFIIGTFTSVLWAVAGAGVAGLLV